MKNKKVLLIVAFLVCICVFKVGIEVGAATSEPGSAGDPLITQSYLESRLQENSGGAGSTYKKVSIKKNSSVRVSEGTEIILYSGNATITGSNGFLNLSSGELFKKGDSVVKYNIFLSPSTGNGIKATTAVTLFIKGSYTTE